ncbi:hypothetical protein HPB52_002172 [Rhipicephalus sanguineus]|uniref:Reverse transcriptase domain-containing protein n=1 Tax=Rhipicephalus sanguineus TaxID=34632 RepID=A0A9D4T8A5_RHISA|nr:hypothetical protein HPB52_002172 [Rhipicephalus sanguineus]
MSKGAFDVVQTHLVVWLQNELKKPLLLSPFRGKAPRDREYQVVDWRAYRRLFKEDTSGRDIMQHQALRAARRRAERQALSKGLPELWTCFRRVDAVCRRHARRRRNQGWVSVCVTIDSSKDGARAWRLLKCLLMVPRAYNQVLSVAVLLAIPASELAECLADQFASREVAQLATTPPPAALPCPASCSWGSTSPGALQRRLEYRGAPGVLANCGGGTHPEAPEESHGALLIQASIAHLSSVQDVVATLEDAKSCGDVAMLLLLDVESAFDDLPHVVVEAAMFRLGISGCLRGFVSAVLSGRTFCVRVGGSSVVGGGPAGVDVQGSGRVDRGLVEGGEDIDLECLGPRGR